MKHRNIISLLVFGMLAASAIVACSNDDTEKATEWNATYVYLQRDNKLKPPVYRLTHSGQGIKGDEVTCSFKIYLQKKLDKDVTVTIADTSKTIPAKNIELSAKEITIKAGETQSGEITISVPDWSFAAKNKDKANYSLNVMMAGIKTDAFNTQISQVQKALSLTVNKSAFTNLRSGKPENAAMIADRSVWKLNMGRDDGGEIYQNASNIIDGDPNHIPTYVLTNDNKGFWITIDLGSVKELAGVNVLSLLDYYPEQIQILSSENGRNWKTQGELDVSGKNQDVSFISPVKAQYLKYNILKGRDKLLAIAEFNIYEANTQ